MANIWNQSPFASSPFSEQEAVDAVGPLGPIPAQPVQPMQPMGPPMQPPPDAQQSPLGRVLSSPGMAMAAQAANNLSALNRGMVPRQTPVDAMRQAANQSQMIQMRRAAIVDQQLERASANRYREAQMANAASAEQRAADLHPLAMQKAEDALNPAAGYKRLVSEGLIDPTEVSFTDYSTLSAAKSLPANIQEWNMYSKLPTEDRQKYLEMKRASQIIGGGGDTSLQVLPGGGTQQIGNTAEQIAAQDAAQASTIDASKQGVAKSGDLYTQLQQVDKSINNIDAALTAIANGAGTGAVEQWLPSITAASITLDNIRNNMGLDIVGAGSFGALSESELAFALSTALPEGLDGPELTKWLENKRRAQSLLRQELADATVYLNGGGTLAGLLEMKQRKSDDDLGSMEGY